MCRIVDTVAPPCVDLGPVAAGCVLRVLLISVCSGTSGVYIMPRLTAPILSFNKPIKKFTNYTYRPAYTQVLPPVLKNEVASKGDRKKSKSPNSSAIIICFLCKPVIKSRTNNIRSVYAYVSCTFSVAV